MVSLESTQVVDLALGTISHRQDQMWLADTHNLNP
jgi:hypothetical protein